VNARRCHLKPYVPHVLAWVVNGVAPKLVELSLAARFVRQARHVSLEQGQP